MAGDTTRDLGVLGPARLPRRYLLGLLALALLAVAPFAVEDITILKLTSALFFAVFVMSWDAVSGYTGQISFGHALFFGVGGYTSGLLNVHMGVDPLLAIPAGAVMAAVAGIAIGVPALRVRGPYLSLITLVAPIILLQVFILYSDVTGGEVGLIGVEKLSLDAMTNYYMAFGLFVFALVVFLAVTRSDAGNVFTAIREDEDAVIAAGLNPAKFKIFAFVLSATIGGLAGAVFAHSMAGSVTPSQLLSLTLSIEVIVAAILGGVGTIVGAAFGGLFFWLLRDWLRGIETVIPITGTAVQEIDLLLFGLITLAFLFYLPEGILPRVIRTVRGLLGGNAEKRTATDGGETPLESAVGSLRDGISRLLGGDRR